jgi:hypothetical protein
MSRQPAAITRSTLAAAMRFRMSLVICLLLVGSRLGADWERQEGPWIGRVFRAVSCRSSVGPGNAWTETTAFELDPMSADVVCRFRQETVTLADTAGRICPPILSNRTSRPPTEGLREDRPSQIRVDVRRWRTAILADVGKLPLGGRLPSWRSVCGASGVRCPSSSLHELFCTWII